MSSVTVTFSNTSVGLFTACPMTDIWYVSSLPEPYGTLKRDELRLLLFPWLSFVTILLCYYRENWKGIWFYSCSSERKSAQVTKYLETYWSYVFKHSYNNHTIVLLVKNLIIKLTKVFQIESYLIYCFYSPESIHNHKKNLNKI